MPIIITGASGFIGRTLCKKFSKHNNVIGLDIKKDNFINKNIKWEIADLTDFNTVSDICKKHIPDVVIHCAGIAHQKIGAVDSATYMRVNSEVTENLAKAAGECNPGVCFVFLSSVSVYGEGPHPRGIRFDKLNATRCGSANLTRQAVTSEFHGAGINPQITQITQNEKDVSRKDAPVRSTRPTGQAKAQKRKNDNGIGENGECQPSSDYSISKLDAERRLIALANEGIINSLFILRLAPVYDREWSFNLNKRVFAPKKMAYIRFGSGLQRMSALARPNLVDFIEFLIHTPEEYASLSQVSQLNRRNIEVERDKNSTGRGFPQYDLPDLRGRRKYSQINDKAEQKNNIQIYNLCDAEPYEFNKIIKVFKRLGVHPNRPIIPIPLPFVWLLTRLAGLLLPKKKQWLHSGYEKLTQDLLFDNSRMLNTGFTPKHTLETIFNPQIGQINAD